MFQINESMRVLAIGSHPDDIELGAGGFIARLRRQKARVDALILTAGVRGPHSPDEYLATKRKDESEAAAEILGMARANVEVLAFPDCQLHTHGHEIIGEIERRLFAPDGARRYDIVLTHAGLDTHADHRSVHESTLSAVRDFHATVLLYQAPSTKPNGFHPSFFVRLEAEDVDRKERALTAHESQRSKSFMTPHRAAGLAGVWSLFLRMPAGVQLEGFEVYKSFCWTSDPARDIRAA